MDNGANTDTYSIISLSSLTRYLILMSGMMPARTSLHAR
jgi:predicted esterase